MDRRERSGDGPTAILAALQGWQGQLWTALPGIVQSFDAAARTVVVQPAIQARVQSKDGTFDWVKLPLLLDCPVQFPSGGGVTLTFPIKANDECLVIFASRCIDAWWQSGGIQVQAEMRMHSLSDGFALVGLNSKPKVIPSISTTAAQLRSDTGATFVEVYPDDSKVRVITTGDINAHANGNVTVDAGQAITATAGTTLTASAGGAVSVHSGADAEIVAAGSLTLGAGGNVNINGVLIINGAPYLDHIHDKTTPGSVGQHSGKVV